MAKIIGLPKLSPTMEEGTLVAWTKNEGDEVDVDDLLAEVETDKATMEFRSFDKGVLLKILVPAGRDACAGCSRRDHWKEGRRYFQVARRDRKSQLLRNADGNNVSAPRDAIVGCRRLVLRLVIQSFSGG